MQKTWPLLGATGILLAALSLCAIAADELPEGPNHDLVVRVCSTCHELQNLISTGGRSRADWDSTLDDMVQYGAEITPQDRALIVQYLATYLPPHP